MSHRKPLPVWSGPKAYRITGNEPAFDEGGQGRSPEVRWAPSDGLELCRISESLVVAYRPQNDGLLPAHERLFAYLAEAPLMIGVLVALKRVLSFEDEANLERLFRKFTDVGNRLQLVEVDVAPKFLRMQAAEVASRYLVDEHAEDHFEAFTASLRKRFKDRLN